MPTVIIPPTDVSPYTGTGDQVLATNPVFPSNITVSGTSLVNAPINVNAPALQVSSTDNDASGLYLKVRSSPGSANARNWAIWNNYNSAGNLDILRSTTNTGAPTTTAFSLDSSSNATLAGALTTGGNIVVGSSAITLQTNGSVLAGYTRSTVADTSVYSAASPSSGNIQGDLYRTGGAATGRNILVRFSDQNAVIGYFGTVQNAGGRADFVWNQYGTDNVYSDRMRLSSDGNLTVSGGTITGGTSGLSLAAAGTNQNVALTPSGSGIVTVGGAARTIAAAAGILTIQAPSSILFNANGANEVGRFNATTGNLLLGGTIDSGNGNLQLKDTSGSSTKGIGFGTDTSLYRDGTGYVSLYGPNADTTFRLWGGATQLFRITNSSTISYVQNLTGSLQLASNGITALTLDSSQNATFAGNALISHATGNNSKLSVIKNTAPALNHIAQVVLGQGVGGGFGANDRTYQLVNNGESSTAAYFGVQYWDGSNYNLRLKIDSAGDATFAGTVTPTGGIVGVTTNSNAAAGIVGEYVSSTVVAGSAITLTTATAANLTSITLTPGDWDVVFVPHFWADGSSVTGTQCVSSLSTTSATLDTTPDRLAQFPSVPTSSADLTVAIPATRFSVTSSTIIYGVVRSTFTVGTNKVYGALSARRVR